MGGFCARTAGTAIRTSKQKKRIAIVDSSFHFFRISIECSSIWSAPRTWQATARSLVDETTGCQCAALASSGLVCWVGQALLPVRCNIAAARADRQECLSYQELPAGNLSHYLLAPRINDTFWISIFCELEVRPRTPPLKSVKDGAPGNSMS